MSDNMATNLRKKLGGRKITSKIIGYTLLGVIGLVFIFMGEFSGRGSMGIGSVARVNDSLISAADLDNEEKRVQEYYSSLFGGSMDLGPQKNMVRQQALESLIRSELASQGARSEGIRASDSEIRDTIMKDITVFQENGQFMRDRYMGYLQAMRMNAGDFENRLRKEIETIRVRQLLEASSFPTSMEMDKLKELQSTKLNVAFAQIDSEKLTRDGQRISADEASKALADADFLKKAEEYFQAYKADWSSPETVTAQHILIAFPTGVPDAEKKALEKIQQIRERAQKEDFGQLASQVSEDPGSKSKKGQLDAFGRGKMVKEFEDAAFAQKIGEIGAPVKTPFGYHLIKVSARTEAKNPDFATVKNEVARRLIAREKMEQAFKALDEAVQKGDSAQVDQLLASMGAKWTETGLFDLANAVPKLPPGPVAEAAFEVTAAQPLLNRVIRDGGSRYVLKFKESKTDAAAQTVANATDLMQKRRAEGLFGAWLESFRGNSRVDVNQKVFQQ
ncbi:MAG: SurA N-terminal domain-containing protein [Bdellovibrionaceae bacterium]|nr:SurA N-terminal domain-containing protein [Pseudobdellovibrionaceae bacterium]